MKTIELKVCHAALIGILLVAIPFAAGWIVGAESGFDTGHRIALIEVGAALRNQLKEGRSFNLRHIEGIKFYPRRDGNLNYRRDIIIAGAGSEGIVRTWQKEPGQ